jgi:hypothetical protein
VLAVVAALDLGCEEIPREQPDGSADPVPLLSGPWPDSVLHFYRTGVSIRSVEVGYDANQEGGAFTVRIMTLSSPEDYDLALRFVAAAAGVLGTDVTAEDGEDSFPADELRARYGADWVARMNRSGASAIAAIIGEQNGPVTLSGPQRPTHIGPNMLAGVRASHPGDNDNLAAGLHALMRRVQWADEGYFAASVLVGRNQDEPEEADVTFAAWDLGVRYLFPDVQYLVMQDAAGLFFIPYARLPELAGGQMSWLDERQTLVEPFPEAEHAEALRRARRYEQRPLK